MAQVARTGGVNSQHAIPVLSIPNALSAAFCQELMDIWKNVGSAQSHLIVENDGNARVSYNHNRKIRRDHIVANTAPIHR